MRVPLAALLPRRSKSLRTKMDRLIPELQQDSFISRLGERALEDRGKKLHNFKD
jgi:hypothetical protein